MPSGYPLTETTGTTSGHTQQHFFFKKKRKAKPIPALFISEKARGPSPSRPALQAEQTTTKPRTLSAGQTTV